MRKPRELVEQARYHVTARANRKEMILDSPRMKALFLDVIAKAKKRYSFRIENFTVMGNHFHLVIQPGRGTSLSRVMQWILSVFAQAYNRLHNLSGHVWEERFFSRIIWTVREYLWTFEYIDHNPVRAGLSSLCGDWAFGGLFFRRRGIRSVIDPLPECFLLLLPGHRQLSLT
jgi:REP element-mobilizing transposase RayT